jgi:hypothetical protein
MTVAYASLRDVYDLGLTARSFVTVSRPLDGRAGDYLDHTTGTFSMAGHDLRADDLVRLVLIASGGSLPGGASAHTIYSPLPVDYWRFRLAPSSGGSAVTFSSVGSSASNGSSSWGIQTDPERKLLRIILNVSSDIDQDLTAHATPIVVDSVTGLYPQKLVGIVARIAARRAIQGMLFENAASKIPSERLAREEARDEEQRAAWRLGQPLYPTPEDQTDGIADNAMRATNGAWPLAVGRLALPWQRGSL